MFRCVILCIMALIMLFSASLVFAHSGGQAKAFFVDKPPEIDANVANEPQWQEVWADSQAADMHMKPEDTPDWFLFDETSPNRISRGVIDDDTDWSAEFAFLFDEEWLYYAYIIKDDIVFDNINDDDVSGEGGVISNMDQLWLEFDYEHDAPLIPKGNDDRDLAALRPPAVHCLYIAGDHFYRLKMFSKQFTTPGCWENNGQNAVLGDRTLFDKECTENLATNRTADGYDVEGKLNFKTIFRTAQAPDLLPPIDGVKWGFDSTNEDFDNFGQPRDGAISWASSFENDNNVCTFGDLNFVGVRSVTPKDKLTTTWGNLKQPITQ